MATITQQRLATQNVQGRLSIKPTTIQGEAVGANQLIKALDPSAQLPYTPSHQLPTPPLSGPARAIHPFNSSHPALTPILDTPLHDVIQAVIAERGVSDGGDESAFFVADLSAVYQAVQMWRDSPMGSRVELFYAVKCNPSQPVLHLLSLLGTSFDCASTGEIKTVLNLPSSPSPDRIIFANPCKPGGFIRSAAENKVDMMTFDNSDELYKIKRFHPSAKLVLRILTDDSKSLCRLGLKFGAPLSSCMGLLKLAWELGLNVIGVSFHVGSGCKDPLQFEDALFRAKRVFDMAKKIGYDFELLDIGGGFERETFDEMSRVVKDGLDTWFPEETGIRVIAEPGRLLVSSAFTLATNVIARRRALTAPAENGEEEPEKSIDEPEAGPSNSQDKEEGEGADVMYYINDGVYGSFNCIMFDHQIVHPYPLTISNTPQVAHPAFPPPPNVHLPVDLPVQLGYEDTEKASVWGPTCDSIDCVRSLVDLPRGLEVGDWIGWGEMGAYTTCAASTFNGFQQSPIIWTTGGDSKEAIAVRATLDAFSGPQS